MISKRVAAGSFLKTLVLFVASCILSIVFLGCSEDPSASSGDTAEVAGSIGVGRPEEAPPRVMVPILMFHDVKTVEGGDWSISAEKFRSVLEFLRNNGYTPISFRKLADYVDGLCGIPEKPVCITLDDGYFSNYRTVLPIITEMKVPITVFMVCRTVRGEGVVPGADENKLCKMSLAELEIMEDSPFVQLGSHTFGLHGKNKTYSESERDCVLPFESESRSEYKEIFEKDCIQAEGILADAGVEETLVFAYPQGKYHKWTEEVLRKRGYRVSLTTDYGHVNLVEKGEPDTLFLLGRMNVNDKTTTSALLKYLERKAG